MSSKLRIGPGFTLPLDAITTSTGTFGIRGSGKTNTNVVIVEELLEHHLQVAIIDPTDAWWGLKSSKDGTKAGYPIIVLGGRHQDLPLAGGDGNTIADFVVDTGASVILSLRHFESDGEKRRLITDFARRLYHRKGQQDNPTPIMVVIDEASLVVPQRVLGEDAHMVGAIQRLVRQGRSSGIGVNLIDARPATVNKDVLAGVEMLITHRVTSPKDRKALQEYVEQHDPDGSARDFLKDLASLEQGVAWFWSPGWLNVFESVEVRERRTFDSSRTPKAGEVAIVPVKMADIDLEAVKARLGQTIEKAKAEDPKELQKRIRELEAQIRKGAPVAAAAPDPAATQARIDRAVDSALSAERRRVADNLQRARRVLADANATAAKLPDLLDGAIARLDVTLEESPAPPKGESAVSRASRAAVAPSSVAPVRRQSFPLNGGDPLGKGERATLIAIAQHDDGVTKKQLMTLTGYKRSTRDTYLQRLGAAGYIEYRGETVVATEAGRAALGTDYEPLPTGDALRAYWLGRLPEGERKILEALTSAWPDSMAKEALSGMTGYTRSSRNTYLQRLGSRKLVETAGTDVRASDMLFDGGAR